MGCVWRVHGANLQVGDLNHCTIYCAPMYRSGVGATSRKLKFFMMVSLHEPRAPWPPDMLIQELTRSEYSDMLNIHVQDALTCSTDTFKMASHAEPDAMQCRKVYGIGNICPSCAVHALCMVHGSDTGVTGASTSAKSVCLAWISIPLRVKVRVSKYIMFGLGLELGSWVRKLYFFDQEVRVRSTWRGSPSPFTLTHDLVLPISPGLSG